MTDGPLSGCRVWEIADTPAGGFAGRMLAYLGASVTMLEPTEGSALHAMPPFANGSSALLAFLGEGKLRQTLPLDPDPTDIHLIVHDQRPLPEGWMDAIRSAPLPSRGRAVVTVLPYGSTGTKQDWAGVELTLFQSGGEGHLMPSGLGFHAFPHRSPIGVGRYLGSYQAGLTAALAGLAALRTSRRIGALECVDISVQDSQLSLNYFTFSRYIDGVLESRANRAFNYGGVVPCKDGYMEIVPLEQHQWLGLCAMLGDPEWAKEPHFKDPIERAAHGSEINKNLLEWASTKTTEEITRLGVEHGVPCGPYLAPEHLQDDPQLRARGFFTTGAAGGMFPGYPVVFDRVARGRSR